MVRWGILGPGVISRAFAADLKITDGAVLVAVGSHSRERAAEFAAEHDIPSAHGSYDELACNPDVDAIYIGTPHAFHETHATLCVSHGKHVLCEKPLAINTEQAQRMLRAAQAADRIVMEAMWTRFLPSIDRVREVIAAGAIGEPRILTADFGFHADFDPSSRLFAPALGGGALLDIGVYIVSLGVMLFGPPVDVTGSATVGDTGVDEENAFVMRHGNGQMTLGVTSFRVNTLRTAVIQGPRGWIRIHAPFWGSEYITVGSHDGGEETLHLPHRGNGLSHEAEVFMQLIAHGHRESPLMPMDQSVSVMRAMDTLRHQWGVSYPGDQ
jgi:predicted dehydrogenase